MADDQKVPEAQPEVKLKPAAVELTNTEKDSNVSDLPYHNKETEKIAASRKPEKTKPYKFEANGYTVTEVDLSDDATILGAVDGKIYKVTADGFEKAFTTKRDAEIYAETHAEAHKDMPATVSKA